MSRTCAIVDRYHALLGTGFGHHEAFDIAMTKVPAAPASRELARAILVALCPALPMMTAEEAAEAEARSAAREAQDDAIVALIADIRSIARGAR